MIEKPIVLILRKWNNDAQRVLIYMCLIQYSIYAGKVLAVLCVCVTFVSSID